MRKNVQHLLVEGPVGKIEVRYFSPNFAEGTKEVNKPLVVISHPHPQFGGTMNNKVVTTLERAYQGLGYSTLVYNFRGVGKSEGEYAGGLGEQEDLQAVVAWAKHQSDSEQLFLAGFSFGAYVTLASRSKLQADRLLLVAPPVSLYDFSGLDEVTVPYEVVLGMEDEVIDFDEMLAWATGLKNRPDLYCRSGASHFLHGQLIWLKKLILSIY